MGGQTRLITEERLIRLPESQLAWASEDEALVKGCQQVAVQWRHYWLVSLSAGYPVTDGGLGIGEQY